MRICTKDSDIVILTPNMDFMVYTRPDGYGRKEYILYVNKDKEFMISESTFTKITLFNEKEFNNGN